METKLDTCPNYGGTPPKFGHDLYSYPYKISVPGECKCWTQASL